MKILLKVVEIWTIVAITVVAVAIGLKRLFGVKHTKEEQESIDDEDQGAG